MFCLHIAVDPEIIARGTVGFSGAELENLVNQAALKAAVDGKEMVTMKELEFSKDKILMGRFLFIFSLCYAVHYVREKILNFQRKVIKTKGIETCKYILKHSTKFGLLQNKYTVYYTL